MGSSRVAFTGEFPSLVEALAGLPALFEHNGMISAAVFLRPGGVWELAAEGDLLEQAFLLEETQERLPLEDFS